MTNPTRLGRTTRIATGILLGGICGFSALGEDAGKPQRLPLSPFGIGGDHHTTLTPEKWIPQMVSIGIKFNRNCHFHWSTVEPEEGKWNWTGVDKRVQFMADSEMETGGVLIGNPVWDKENPPGTPPVNNLAGWSRYVSNTVVWDLDDAQFVNMYGYDFSLDSDGKKYDKYYIQSVTVEKVAH